MSPIEYLGNIILLIVGGNDTTRNSMSGGALALNEYPDEYAKLLDNPDWSNMVPEIIRWQTPLAHMRRTALADTELRGQEDQEGRQGRHAVRLGQPRRRGDRETRTPSSSTARGPGSISPSASASTVASARTWPKCN